MICPSCQSENPAAARFCQNCGMKLEQICPQCKSANAVAAKFCISCGTRLGDVTPMTSRRPESAVGERRVVTVLFCDVKGSTALAEQLDPERWAEIMDGAFRHLTAAVLRYDGTVARLMGDAILAFFGAPTAHEDDPLRAVRAGLDILDNMRPYQQRVMKQLLQEGLEPGSSDFEVRVGINTGLVVVGRVGSEMAGEYTAMGDAVNVAARMEQTAVPGTIQIAHDTFRLVAPMVEVETLGTIEIKGKRQPVAAYRVLGLKAEPGRLRGIAGIEAPLVGRDDELVQLSTAFAGLDQGFGKIVFLTGEAGLGKSRLLRELQAVLTASRPARSIQWYQVASLSFEDDLPYGLIRRLVRQLVGATEGDTQQTVRERIDRLLEGVVVEHPEQIRSALLALFSPATGEHARLEGEALSDALAAGMLALWERQAGRAPTVLVFDDLHWTDPASTSLIAELLPLAHRVPILFLCVCRPDRDTAAWRLRRQAQTDFSDSYLEIALRPLSPRESGELANSLLAEYELTEALQQAILGKAEGIPFFLEELVRDLVESGALVKGGDGGWTVTALAEEITVPENLESLLVSRMDRLQAPTRRTLQLASVIGRSFNVPVLARVAGDDVRLKEQLSALEQADLIQEVTRLPEREYTFRHALTQEAAYNTILLKERRQYHRRVGEVMAELFAGELEEHAPLLARHFDRAGEQRRAAAYYAMAADNAARLYANDEALAHYTRALQAAGEAAEARTLAGLYRGRGATYERTGDFDRAHADLEKALNLAHLDGDLGAEWRALLDLGMLWAARDYGRTGDLFQQAMDLARQMDDPAILAGSLNRIGNWHVNAKRPVDGMAFHQEALALFEQLGDQSGMARTLDLLGMASMIAGDMVASINHYRRAIDLFRELDDRQGMVSAGSMVMHGPGSLFTYTEVPAGGPDEFEEEYQEILPLARQIGWRAGEAFALEVISVRDALRGDFARALEAGQEALRLATAIEHHQWILGAHIALGIYYLATLAPERAIEHLEQALMLAEELRSRFWFHYAISFLARSHLGMDQPDRAMADLERAIRAETSMETVGLRLCWLVRAELALAQTDPALALDITERMIATSANMGSDVVISILWLVRGQALLALGRVVEAEATLKAGLENAQRRTERALIWRFHAGLTRLYREMGRPEEASQQITQGQAAIELLASTIPNERLRHNFQQRARPLFTERGP